MRIYDSLVLHKLICALSSVGRAIHLHWKGQEFESLRAHSTAKNTLKY